MGIFSRFENKMEDTVEGAASRISKAPISPVQIAKRAERQMRRETMVGAGKEYAPTLYTVLVNPDDDARLFGYYPTLAGETETYLKAHAMESGLVMDGDPLVRFIVDEGLRHGKFDVIAETVSAPIIAQLRKEEMQHYGLVPEPPHPRSGRHSAPVQTAGEPARRGQPAQKPYGGYDEQARAHSGGVPPRRAADTIGYAGDIPDRRTVRARLVELASGRPYDLTGLVTIGRDTGCDIAVKDINASRNHAQISQDPQGNWVVADLGSTNGTLVNGQAVASQPLYVGDVITIGKTDFEFALA